MNLRDHWCKHCLDGIEHVFHILREYCPLAKAIWCNVLTMEVRGQTFCVIASVDSYLNLSRLIGLEVPRKI
jgi:hypothetical protein